jgi:hypothetical protein
MDEREMATLQAEYEASILCHSKLCPLSSPNAPITCYTTDMFNRSQLIAALLNEYTFLCHDDFDPSDPTPDEFLAALQPLSDDQLIAIAGDDIDEFISTWS